ncbi:response regulator [Larkinella soli]|uniref:response regulator n=1 Tax=Larkinella soli TaxID=1770527 RepID=UPI000FFBC864|nr:response regulator [Larkinella soli]
MRKYKIVIAENDEDEQFFMRKGFDETGLFDILAQVRNGDDLLEWLRDNRSTLPDIILSDLNMPGKNGYDVITTLENDPGYTRIPVIITSTSSTKTIMDKCLAIGAAGYLVKPETFIEYKPYVENLHRFIEDRHLVRTAETD